MKIYTEGYFYETVNVNPNLKRREDIVDIMKKVGSSEDNPIEIVLYQDEKFCFDNVLFKNQVLKEKEVYYHEDLGFFTKRFLTRRGLKGQNYEYNIEFERKEDLLNMINDLIQYLDLELNTKLEFKEDIKITVKKTLQIKN